MSTIFGTTKCTQEDKDNLADVAWYIKGLIAAGDGTFDEIHVDSIRDAMNLIKQNIEENKASELAGKAKNIS